MRTTSREGVAGTGRAGRLRTGLAAGLTVALTAGTALLLSPVASASTGVRPPQPDDRVAATVQAQTDVTELRAGGPALVPGTWLVSPGGRYELGVDTDGLLVVQEQGNWLDPDGHTWYLPDTGYQDVDRLVMQADGNLVGYGPTGVVVSYATLGSGAVSVRLGDDKRLHLSDASGAEVASRRTSGDLFLERGDFLLPGEELTGERGVTRVLMQTDGNLVLYRGSTALWSTRTQGNPGAGVVMQTDGNLVVYSSAATGRRALYATGTTGYDQPEVFPYLRVEDTEVSVVVQYDGGAEAVFGSAWTSSRVEAGDALDLGDRRRSPDGRCVLVLQDDINLVQYCDGRAWFRTGARPDLAYDPAARQAAVMQGDGNFVVYGRDGDRPVATFDTGTRVPGSSLVLQDDRNVVVVAPGGVPVWSAFTGRLR